MKYLVLIIISVFSFSSYAESWLEKNYDVHLTCSRDKFCVRDTSNCKKSNPMEIELHFNLENDLDEYTKYKKYSPWLMEDRSSGLVECVKNGCSKHIITSVGGNFIYAYSAPKFIENRKSAYFGEYKLSRTTGELVTTEFQFCENIFYEDGRHVECNGYFADHFGLQPDYWVTSYEYFSCQKTPEKLF